MIKNYAHNVWKDRGCGSVPVLYEPTRGHATENTVLKKHQLKYKKKTKKTHQLNEELTKNISRCSCSSGDWDCNHWRRDTQGLDQLIDRRVSDGDQVNGRLHRKGSAGCGGEVRWTRLRFRFGP